MSGSGRISRLLTRALRRRVAALLCAGALLCAAVLLRGGTAAAQEAAAPAPRRVVSMNLCTDQLAMMLAAPGQLVSVSRLSQDPQSSAMVAEARRYPANDGQAERIFLMHPDLVLAGRYTARASVALLRRLGVRVVTLPPAESFDDMRRAMREVGRLLGREAEAEAELARFDADLATLRAEAGEPPGPKTMLYGPAGYTSGRGTLSDAALRAAGLRNLAAAAGVTGYSVLPLERLVMAAPDLVVSTLPYPGASEAEAILHHPALRALERREGPPPNTGPDWTCGTPRILNAVREMIAARRRLEGQG